MAGQSRAAESNLSFARDSAHENGTIKLRIRDT
jgi:hypothetical protein